MNKINENMVRFTNFLAALVFTLLGLRFVLRLFGANSANSFVSWIYDMSQPILQPFENIFPSVRVEDGFVVELSTLFAMLIYGILAGLLLNLIAWIGKNHK